MNWAIITRHYVKRAFIDPLGLAIFLLIPTAMILLQNFIINANIEGDDHIINGYNAVITESTIAVMIIFLLMGGMYIIDYIFTDFRGANRWRLIAAPATLSTYFFGALIASVAFSVVSSMAVLGVSYLVFDMYFGNWHVMLALVLLLAIFSQLLGILMSLLIKKKKTAESAFSAVIMLSAIMAGGFMGINLNMPDAIRDNTPLLRALRVATYSGLHDNMSGAMFNFGILAAMTAVLAVAVFIIGRKKPL